MGRHAFLTDAWDRVLFTAPGVGPTTRVPRSRDTRSVAVASAAQYPLTSSDPKDLWLLVVILDGASANPYFNAPSGPPTQPSPGLGFTMSSTVRVNAEASVRETPNVEARCCVPGRRTRLTAGPW